MGMDLTSERGRNLVAALVCGVVALVAATVLLGLADARHAWAEAAAKVADGGKMKVEPMVATCVWWATAGTGAVAVLAGGLSLLARRFDLPGWIGPKAMRPLVPSAPAFPRWFLLGLAGAVLLGTCLRLPRMGLSLYNDESHNYVRIVAGEWKDYGGEDAKFRRPRWTETAFRNSTGNNGFFYSILARVCHDLWRKSSGAVDGQVKEWPIRLPALAAGLLTIGVVGLAGARMGSPAAGLAASFLLAIHPWHVRYSTEARGYAIMVLAVAAGYLFLMAALQSGKWWPWVAHGLCQFFALWANPGSLIAVTIGQGAIALLLAFWWWVRRRPMAMHHVFRWAGGGVLAVLLAAFLLTPGMIQLKEQLKTNPAMVGSIPPGWWRDTLFFLGNGCGWGLADWENPVNPGSVSSPLRMAGAVAFFGMVGLGSFLAWRDHRARVALVLAAMHFFSLVPFYLRSVLSSNVLLWWYALPALPGLVLMAGFAFARPARRKWAWPMAAVFVAAVVSALSVLLFHGKSDGRSLVRLARGGDFPDFRKDVVTFDLWSDAVTFDPLARWADSIGQLQSAGAKADSMGIPLFVYTAHEGKAAITHPEVLAYLKTSGAFELAHTAWALESPVHDNRLYRWKGKSRNPEIPASEGLRPGR
jgi:Dolichyl-phosphate-mannose-protein mannosyltransferase